MKNGKSVHHYVEVVFLMILLVMFPILCSTIQDKKMEKEQTQIIDEGWYYWENGNKIEITLPTVVEYEGDSLVLYHEQNGGIENAQMLMTKSAKYDLEAYVGETCLYQYNDYGLGRNELVLNNMPCLISVENQSDDELISFVYHKYNDDVYELNQILAGDWNAIWLTIFKENAVTLFMTLLMIVLGVLSLGLSIVVKSTGSESKRLIYISAFLLVCGGWCLTDSPFTQLIAGYRSFIVYINFAFFMLIPVAMIYYIRSTPHMRKYKILTLEIDVCYLNIFCQFILVCLGKSRFFDMLWVTHLLFVVEIILAIALFLYEYHQTGDKELFVCMLAFATEGMAGIMAILAYAFLGYAAYQAMFQVGVLAFVVILMYRQVQELLVNMRYRTEAEIYRRLSEEDKMTGLKNRRAFDLMINNLETNQKIYNNAAMIYIDLNGLKHVNDKYGHAEGDLLIMAAGQCISKAYSDVGICYRIGGDEFCVIIINCDWTESELWERLRVELDRYNNSEEAVHKLSVAFGCSFINSTELKVEKTIQEWRDEADQNMYLDKQRKKSRKSNKA